MTLEEMYNLCEKKNRGKSAATEHDLQVACLRWLGYAHPKVFCYAIPNGAYTTITSAKKLVAEGVKKGVPDLHFPISRNGFASLYVEMKNGKAGVVSAEQKAMIKKLQSLGNKVVVCRSLDDFMKEINQYFNNEGNEYRQTQLEEVSQEQPSS